MEIKMVIDITKNEEELLEQLGIPMSGWQYEHQDFLELNFELKANGVPCYASFEQYLNGRVEYRNKLAEIK
jgi:hypothetical protein